MLGIRAAAKVPHCLAFRGVVLRVGAKFAPELRMHRASNVLQNECVCVCVRVSVRSLSPWVWLRVLCV